MSLSTIDVSDLVGHPGASREQRLTGTLEGLATEVATVPDDVPIEAELLLESVLEGILVSGTLRGTFRLTCSRCLTGFEAPFDVTWRLPLPSGSIVHSWLEPPRARAYAMR